jgi:hypothetical protein
LVGDGEGGRTGRPPGGFGDRVGGVG